MHIKLKVLPTISTFKKHNVCTYNEARDDQGKKYTPRTIKRDSLCLLIKKSSYCVHGMHVVAKHFQLIKNYCAHTFYIRH